MTRDVMGAKRERKEKIRRIETKSGIAYLCIIFGQFLYPIMY
jgi:hypothetical protein